MKKIAAALAAVLLGGCSAQLTFIDRADGQRYTGVTQSTAGNSGEASAQIDGATYSGDWIYSSSGGGYSLSSSVANATAFGTGGMATARGQSFTSTSYVATSGNGLIALRGPSHAMRCVFNFNTMSNTGTGSCERTDGRLYDLMIRR